MTSSSIGDFGQRVLETYDDRRSRQDLIQKGALRSVIELSTPRAGLEIRTGHPIAANIAIGEQRICRLVSVFLDLTDFTGRTYWDHPSDVANLAHAVLSTFTVLVEQCGGWVLGLRGDGLYAGFGPDGDPARDGVRALICAARALYEAETSLNPRLTQRGIEPVKVRAGVDWGDSVFVRSGSSATNEVNIIGFAPNFAAKCEKRANSWEIIAGQGLKNIMPDAGLFTTHAESPKIFQRRYERRAYAFYDYHWRQLVPEFDAEVRNNPLPAATGGS